MYLFMLEYAKTVLENVSFCPNLFSKEFVKLNNWVKPEEQMELHNWCMHNYASRYKEIVYSMHDRSKLD